MEWVILILTVVFGLPPAIDASVNLYERRKIPMKEPLALKKAEMPPSKNRLARFLHRITPACIIAFVISGLSTVVLMEIRTHSAKIPEPDSYWENCYTNPPARDDEKTDAFGAFLAGKYAYSFLMYSDWEIRFPDPDDPRSSWQSNRPLLYASQLAQNPTEDGYRTFNKQLDELYGEIERQIKTPQTQKIYNFNSFDAVDDVILKLRIASGRLLTEQREHINVIIQRVKKLESDKIKTEPAWRKEK
jgi:hypothetical protein